jgi:hypothetical protein
LIKHLRTSTAVLFLSVLPVIASEPGLAVDRGLPPVNLNNSSGESRSNVRWTGQGDGFVGDDFSIGAPGETWVIDTIRTWAVPQIPVTSSAHLGDFYQDLRLYFGTAAGNSLTPIASAELAPGADEPESTSIRVADVTHDGAIPYDDFGTSLRIWKVEFHPNKVVQGGVKYAFGVWGMGRPIPNKQDKIYPWFNLASNAPLSASRQDGADGVLLLFDGGGKFDSTFDSKGSGWDKSSDLNVQVVAHRVKSTAE